MNIDARIKDAFLAQNGFSLEDSCVLFAKIGSHSHGTYIPSTDPNSIDDIDYMGIVIPPQEYVFGMKTWEHWVYQHEELDVVIYSLPKAINMLYKSNPNIIGLLWLSKYEYTSGVGTSLLFYRDMFSSKKIYKSFIAYAKNQLDKMTAFDPVDLLRYQDLKNKLESTGTIYTDEDFAEFTRLKKKYFSGYMGEKRKEMVVKYGYDVKDASHTLRLLTMGTEFLNTGILNVDRTDIDADFLKDIKLGKYKLAEIVSRAEKLFAEADNAYNESTLPEEPSFDSINQLLINIQGHYYFTNYIKNKYGILTNP